MTSADFVKIAIDSLDKATKLENESKYNESLPLYAIGLDILMNTTKMPDCEKSFPNIKNHIKDFMERAELLKEKIEKENQLHVLKLSPGQHQQIKIEKFSTGHSYHSIFNKFLVTGDVTEVNIDDPYIKDPFQISNFVAFCEMLLKSASKIKRINLLTKPLDREDHLNALVVNLHKNGVELKLSFNNNLHDREIRFNNGWIVKIGRGLDYFRRLPNDFMIGMHDLDLRQCLETTVDIFHQKSVCGDNK